MFATSDTARTGTGTYKSPGDNGPARFHHSRSLARNWPAAETEMPAPAASRLARPFCHPAKPDAASADVAHDLRIHPEARPARQQPVVLVPLVKRRGHVRRLPVGRAVHDQTLHVLDVPACARLFSPAAFTDGSMNSTASQSSKPGCDGVGARMPKSSGVSSSPTPNNDCHSRFTKTRAVVGDFRSTSHFAKVSRLSSAPLAMDAEKPACPPSLRAPASASRRA